MAGIVGSIRDWLPSSYIRELVVAEAFEDRGIGRRLIAAAEAWTIESSYRCITLHTGAANHRARSFYARHGYEEEEINLTKVLRQLECELLISPGGECPNTPDRRR